MGVCVLAFDTATERMVVALATPAGHWLANMQGGAAASAALLPQATALLKNAGIGWRALDSVAFGRGPGAFTGLRTACAVAQGLGLALAKPLLAVDSLLIVAEDARTQAGAGEGFELWVAMDARMDEAYAGAFRYAAGGWQVLQPAALFTLPALAERWAAAPPSGVAGSALAAFGSRLPIGAAAQWPQEHDRAAALLRCALALHAAGAGVDAADALPLYLRDKVALTTAERAVAAAARSGQPTDALRP